jgi:hypothetical protein
MKWKVTTKDSVTSAARNQNNRRALTLRTDRNSTLIHTKQAMKRGATAVLFIALVTTTPVLSVAKGPTVKIIIESRELPAPIQITDPNLQQFNVWSGPPGATRGFIIDATNGAVEAPIGFHHYKISFYAVWRSTKPTLTYVVFYDYDASTKEGFVYLPGKHEEFGRLNTSAISRAGFDGHWFRATPLWDNFFRRTIEKAAAKTAAR